MSNFVVDIALVDLKLGSEDGARVIAELRKLLRLARLVAISGEIDSAVSLPAGADAALAKLFTIQQLLAAVIR